MRSKMPPRQYPVKIVEATRRAINLHRKGDLPAAGALYERVLQAAPEYPDALHFYGLLQYHQDRPAEAEKYLRRAIALAPGYADPYNNLGNILKELGRPAEAEVFYRKHLELRPGSADAYNNLGISLKDQGRHDEAVLAYRKALARAPQSANVHHNLANALKKLGQFDAALAEYRRAIALDLRHIEAHVNLGRMLYLAGRRTEAADVYRHWLDVVPNDPVATHMVAACTGDAPPRASDAYVQTTFDRFAGSFDEVLARLGYQAPAHVAAAVCQYIGMASGDLDVLDAGCGTGLCGPLLRAHARRLCGVDLSPAMLAKSAGRGVYDELVEAELGAFLMSCPARWDVIVSADTLCYFGVLESVCASAASALRRGGWVIFTVESVETSEAPTGYRIAPHGRYGHTRDYVGQVLARADFHVVAIDRVILRNEARSPVPGWLVVARRDSSDVD
jgi:predicted TPR repeat methyltransferase